MALPNVTDLKVHLTIPAEVTENDAELGDHLDAAIEMVENIVGPLVAASVTEIHRGVNSDILVLRRMPVTELTAISARYSSTDTTALTLSDYELDTDTGIVRLVDGSGFYGTYVVEYGSGRAALPASIKLAILIVAGHLYETQRMPMQNDVAAPPGFGGGIDAAMPTSRGYALPNRALELLRPYALVFVA